jgi:large subunit ribosomal protein L13
MEHLIDATGKKVGRIATEAAVHLRGKDEPSFVPHLLSGNTVRIINASKVSIDERKQMDKVYTRYTGYPGGLKTESLRHLAARRGYAEIIRKAIYGMLPSNRLRARMMKQLTITENE